MYAGGTGPMTTDTNLRLDKQYEEKSRREARELELQTLAAGNPDATESLLGLGLFAEKSAEYIAFLQYSITTCERKRAAIIRLKDIVAGKDFRFEEEDEKQEPLIPLLQSNIVKSILDNTIGVLDEINIRLDDAKLFQIFKDNILQAYTNKTLQIKSCKHVDVVDVLNKILNDKRKLFAMIVEIYRGIDDQHSAEKFKLESVDKSARL